MNSKTPILSLIMASFAALPVFAGESKTDPPTAPFVAPVPARVDWTVSLQDNPDKPATGGRPQWLTAEVHSTKVQDIKRDVITYANGTKAERWYADGLLLWKSAQGDVVANQISSASGRDSSEEIPSVVTGFPGVQWVGLAHYDKVVPYKKRPCYHYVNQDKEAWIDTETLLPAAYKVGDRVYRYKFNPETVEALTMPDDFQKAFDAYEKLKPKEQEEPK